MSKKEKKRRTNCAFKECRSDAIKYITWVSPMDEGYRLRLGECQRCGCQWPEFSTNLGTYFKEGDIRKANAYDKSIASFDKGSKIQIASASQVQKFGKQRKGF